MVKRVTFVFVILVLGGLSRLGIPDLSAQTTLPNGMQSSYETVEAPVLKVFSAEQEGHRFVAYLVKWKDFEVIVSDPLGRSDFQKSDKIRFLAQKMSLSNGPIDVSTLNFILVDPPEVDRADIRGDRGSGSPAEQNRQLKIVEGDLEAAKNETERFYALNHAAKNALKAGKSEEAQKLADELLRLAQIHKNDWNYGNAIQDSNQILGRIALAKGNVKEAKKRLLASADSEGSPQMNSFGPNMQLAKELLAQGEKEAVLEYFKRCSAFWEMGSDKLTAWSESVSKGQTPDFGANLAY